MEFDQQEKKTESPSEKANGDVISDQAEKIMTNFVSKAYISPLEGLLDKLFDEKQRNLASNKKVDKVIEAIDEHRDTVISTVNKSTTEICDTIHDHLEKMISGQNDQLEPKFKALEDKSDKIDAKTIDLKKSVEDLSSSIIEYSESAEEHQQLLNDKLQSQNQTHKNNLIEQLNEISKLIHDDLEVRIIYQSKKLKMQQITILVLGVLQIVTLVLLLI